MKLWASPKWRKLTKKERKHEYWKGLWPHQRDMLRLMGAEIPEGISREPETERGLEAKRLVEEWYENNLSARS